MTTTIFRGMIVTDGIGSILLTEAVKIADAKANLLRHGVPQEDIDNILNDTSRPASTLQRLEAKLDSLHGQL